MISGLPSLPVATMPPRLLPGLLPQRATEDPADGKKEGRGITKMGSSPQAP